MRRVLILATVFAVTLAAAGTADAATGALTFSGCVQATASVSAPCAASSFINGPTDLQSAGGALGVTSSTGNAFATLSQSALSPAGCVGNGTTTAGCSLPTALPAGAFADPEGVAIGPATYIAGSTNNDIAVVGGVGTNACVAQGAALGCATAHGLDHPTHLAFARTAPADLGQLYAATADGVAWFDVSGIDGHLTFAGCLKPGSGDTCGATSFQHATSIAVSPDATSVYVGSSDGGVVGYSRAADGTLTQISCISEAPAPSGCATGIGIQRVSGIAVSPDGKIVYAVSTLGQALAEFVRLDDGTITEVACLAAGSADGCAADSQLATPNSVAVSPDSLNVYVGNTANDVAVLNRGTTGSLTPAGCLGGHGSTCSSFGFLNYAGGIAVTPDGKWVDVASQDANGVTAFARTRQSADLEVTGAAPATSGTTVTRDFTVVNHGPDPSTGANLVLGFGPVDISLDAATGSGGPCTTDTSDSHDVLLVCPLGTLAAGASGHVTVSAPAPTFFTAVAAQAVFIDDPTAANNEVDTTVSACSDGSLTAGTCPGPTPTPTPTPTPHAAKLAISSAKFSPSTFIVKPTGRAAHRHHVHHAGSHITFKLSHAAPVTISFALVRKGHRDRAIGQPLLDKAAGTRNSIAFSGHLHGKALKPGRYHATLRASLRGFTSATPRTISFTIARN